MNIKKSRWDESEIRYVKDHYANERGADIANSLKRSLATIYKMAAKLGLKKSREFLASPLSGRTDGTRGMAGRFKPGQKSWNAGLHYSAGGRSAEARFKAGHAPHNELPVGSYRINGEGYLDRKTNDRRGNNSVRWKPVHRLVWIDAHGPIPPGHVVTFKIGMKTNKLEEITVDRLECISRKELSTRNHPMSRGGPELFALVQLKGAITRQLNRRIKEEQKT